MNLTKEDRLFRFLILLLPVFFLPYTYLGAQVSKFYFAISAYSILLLIHISTLLKREKISFRFDQIISLNFLLFIFIFAGMIFSEFRTHVFINMIYLFIPGLLFSLYVVNGIEIKKESLYQCIFYSGLIPFIVSFFLWFFAGNQVNYNFFAGTFGNQNWFSSYIVLIMFYPLVCNKINWKHYLVFSLYVLFVFFSGSRNSILSFLIITFLFLLTKLIKKKRMLITLLLIVFILSVPLIKNIALKRFSSIEYRLYQYKISSELIKDIKVFFIGTGFSSYSNAAMLKQNELLEKDPDNDFLIKNKNVITHAHNDYIEFFVENGFFSFCIFLYIIFYIFRKSGEFLKTFPNVFLSSYLLLSLFSFPLKLSAHNFLLFIMLTTIFVKEKKEYICFDFRFRKAFILRSLIIIVIFLFNLKFIFFPVLSRIVSSKAIDVNDNIDKYSRYNRFAYLVDSYNFPLITRLAFDKAAQGDFKSSEFFIDKSGKNQIDSNYFSAIALNFENIGENSKAIYYYQKAIYVSEKYFFPYNRIILLHLKEKNVNAALNVIDSGIKNDNYYRFYLLGGEISFKDKQTQRSIQYFSDLLNNLERFNIKDMSQESIKKICYFRLFLLTGNQKYIKETLKYKGFSAYIDKELEKFL